MEMAGSSDLTEVRRIANLTASMLPGFASQPYQDERAPQNLLPVGLLETQLRHLLGNPDLMASSRPRSLPPGGDSVLEPAGQVMGTDDSFALDFWVNVEEHRYLQLDDVVTVPILLPDGQSVTVHGVVDTVRSRLEGARFGSDAKRAREGIMPFNVANAAHVAVTRVEPEIFVAPFPGSDAFKSEGLQREQALYFDKMLAAETAFCAGLSRDGQPVYGNLEFLDGSRGAHVNISGICGVATKTTYALFLLYGLFHSRRARRTRTPPTPSSST